MKSKAKTQLIEAAGVTFSRFGYRKTTMDDIAFAAGKGKSSLYYYFKNKEEVFEAVVEKEALGGICLNWGCIPTKALLKNAEVYRTLTHKAAEFGLKIEGLSYDWSAVIGRSRKVSSRLAGGIEFLFKKNKIDFAMRIFFVEFQ